jgi:hypothetical protein
MGIMQDFGAQLKRACAMAWLVMTAVSVVVVLLLLVLPAPTLSEIGARLQLPHEWCPFCGMTRSLVALKQLEVARSAALNPGAGFLAAAWCANSLAGAAFVGRRLRGLANRRSVFTHL